MKGYKTTKWEAFRQEVIELDGGACRVCRRGEPEVVLQVHHQKYIPGKPPWDYAYSDCETLCKGCHAREHGIIRPAHGWEFLGYEDLGELIGSCELCGHPLRHQFYVHHERWGTMEVGTYCCDSLTDTELASNAVESQKRHEDRKRRFIRSTRWSERNGVHSIAQQKLTVRILPSPSGFHIEMNGTRGKHSYPTLEEAKARVFEVIDSGEAQAYLARATATA